MKILITALVLSTSLGWAAEYAESEDAPVAGEEQEIVVKQNLDRLMEHTKRLKEHVAKQAEHAIELAKSKIALAELSEPGELGDIPAIENGVGFAFAGGNRAATQPLLIRTSDLDPATTANLQEDLAVMSRILSKNVGKEGHDSAMGIVISAIPGMRRPQSLYLEGYGALFMLSVKFPLVPAVPTNDTTPEKPVDTTWEETKRELNGGKPGNFRVFTLPPGADATAEFSQEQVDNLKRELIESLKNASNIRNLKPDEFVTVVVLGNRASGGGTRVKRATARGGAPKKVDVYVTAEAKRESTLTLRAKKSDIDAFAKGTVDEAEFTKRTSVSAY